MDVIKLAEKALNVRALYHKVISSNIANIDTPGYREKDVDFKKQLERQMSDSKEVDTVETESRSIEFGSLDENTVNLEDQIMKLNENSLFFDALVQSITKKFALIRYVITEGRR